MIVGSGTHKKMIVGYLENDSCDPLENDSWYQENNCWDPLENASWSPLEKASMKYGSRHLNTHLNEN